MPSAGSRAGASPPATTTAAATAASAAASSTSIDAFTLQPVLEEPRLLCLEAWGSTLLLGLSGGWEDRGCRAP